MLFNSDAAKCRLCSRLSSAFRGFFFRFIGRWCCAWINWKTSPDDFPNRVGSINTCAPDCACEKHRMSRYSPNPVSDHEQLSRFIFFPMHYSMRKGKVLPSLFSYATRQGCSVQREDLGATAEISSFVSKFINKNKNAVWLGVVGAKCGAVRLMQIDGYDSRSACVYDTAEKHNPAHAEICCPYSVPEEGDANELRNSLMKLFNAGSPIAPNAYRNGVVREGLTTELRNRSIPLG